MSRRDNEPVPLDAAAIEADDRALDAFAVNAATPAVSWDTADSALTVLAALREDVAEDLPGTTWTTPTTPAVHLATKRSGRSRHTARRTVVAGAVTAAVLSVSGVAAAAIASGPGAALYPIHKLLLGPEQTHSQHAATQVRHFLRLADGDLKAGRVTAAGEELRHASTWLVKVDAVERGDLPAQLAAMQARYADALAAARHPGDTGGVSGDDDGADNRGGNSGHGSGNSGDDSPGKSGADHGSGNGSGAQSGHGSGDQSGDHSSRGGTGGNSGSGSAGSGSGGSSGDSGDDTSGSGSSDSGSGQSGSGSHGSDDIGHSGSGDIGHKGSDG